MPIVVAVLSVPEFSLIALSSDSLSNELVDSPPDELAVSKGPDDSDDELTDLFLSSAGAIH